MSKNNPAVLEYVDVIAEVSSAEVKAEINKPLLSNCNATDCPLATFSPVTPLIAAVGSRIA